MPPGNVGRDPLALRPAHSKRGAAVAGLAAVALVVLAGGNACAEGLAPGSGKLLLTGGVTSIDGVAGGGLTPWATTASYATQGEIGVTAFFTRALTQDYALNAYGVAVGVGDRLEVSLARQEFDAGVVVPGTTLRQTIGGIKVRVWGDAVLDSDQWWPQIAVGAEFKQLDPGPTVGALLESVGARRHGTDVYVAATKLWLAQGVLTNATLRSTRANQNGLLGFGSVDQTSRRLEPEFSIAYLLRRDLAVGAEFRRKPDNLRFAGEPFAEDDWKDLFIAWAPNKHVSLTAAWVDLGNIVGHTGQRGAYLSVQFAL